MRGTDNVGSGSDGEGSSESTVVHSLPGADGTPIVLCITACN